MGGKLSTSARQVRQNIVSAPYFAPGLSSPSCMASRLHATAPLTKRHRLLPALTVMACCSLYTGFYPITLQNSCGRAHLMVAGADVGA